MCLAIPGKVIEIQEGGDPMFRSGKVSFEGILRSVNLSMVPDVRQGDYVLVHVGVALNKVDEAEAKRVFSYLQEIGEVEEALGDKKKLEK